MADLRKEAGRRIAADYLPGRLTDSELKVFTRNLVDGTCDHIDEIDERIRAAAENWEMTRMAALDRNILRMAVYELAYCDDIPPKVAINEAIDLAKQFGAEESGQFVNGILDKIKRTLDE